MTESALICTLNRHCLKVLENNFLTTTCRHGHMNEESRSKQNKYYGPHDWIQLASTSWVCNPSILVLKTQEYINHMLVLQQFVIERHKKLALRGQQCTMYYCYSWHISLLLTLSPDVLSYKSCKFVLFSRPAAINFCVAWRWDWLAEYKYIVLSI